LNINVNEENEPHNNWETLKNNILLAAKKALGTRKVNAVKSSINRTPWFCKEV